MSRQTLTQRKGLRLVVDTRTAGQLKHGEREWSHPEHRPITQISAKPSPKPVPTWIVFGLSAICLVAVTYAVAKFAAWVLPIIWSH